MAFDYKTLERAELDTGTNAQLGQIQATEEGQLRREKAIAAQGVARWILWIMAGTFGIILIVFPIILACRGSADVTKDLTTLLDGLTKLATAFFAPLLAFILGYYFSDKQTSK